MHPDQVDVTSGVVAALVAAQFPRWRHHPVRPVVSHGTVNALFRLGEGIVLRFPLRPSPEHRDELVREQEVARRIAPQVPLPVPEPLALGEPGPGYPGVWTAYRWIPGTPLDDAAVGDPVRVARDLAGFVTALHGMDTAGAVWPGRGRGGPLHLMDGFVQRCLAGSVDLVDTARLGRIWAGCRDAPAHTGADVWVHADLMPGNLLVRDGRLAAVIDLGTVNFGDPAVDLMPAWNLMGPAARDAYRRALGVDDATWERGRGWALVQAIGALPYYVDTNPVMAATARRTLGALLDASG
ncbi:aminoglycoside phosphotransferase family protein [Micromonospora globbae]|jgi:aminoglycoside phosphotransferase (APT) family kinase protein|uniref:Aminoglycoside phosphotransferase family protein n=1 Tax=Micromonospora globbae TaxID=1894969 RepID=A0A420F457_9ACTN|nr:aminoglycoside phosphotransferase family protein [Micromonospora globbae]RKF27696.1 aminoglycoside phosphotransferase family protein [Micromonospora globbae]